MVALLGFLTSETVAELNLDGTAGISRAVVIGDEVLHPVVLSVHRRGGKVQPRAVRGTLIAASNTTRVAKAQWVRAKAVLDHRPIGTKSQYLGGLALAHFRQRGNRIVVVVLSKVNDGGQSTGRLEDECVIHPIKLVGIEKCLKFGDIREVRHSERDPGPNITNSLDQVVGSDQASELVGLNGCAVNCNRSVSRVLGLGSNAVVTPPGSSDRKSVV